MEIKKMHKKFENCTRKYLFSLNELCEKQWCIIISEAKIFKANRGLSDARLVYWYTRLGFRFSDVVKHLNIDLPLSHYPAASPLPPDLLFPHYPAASRTVDVDSRRFFIFKYLPTAIGSGVFNNHTLRNTYRFQQPATVKVNFASCRHKQDFSFTPSEPIAFISRRQMQITGPVKDEIVSISIDVPAKREVQ
jgi:hypothetical protein